MQEDRIVNGKIYVYLNKINNKAYIGKTISLLQRRKSEHKYNAFTKNTNTHFYNALRKYGADNFAVSVLLEKEMTIKELNHWEETFIALFETRNHKIGYNTTKGGDGNRYIDFDRKEAIRLYEHYKNAQKVSEIMGVKYWNIYSLLRNRGIPVLGKHAGKKVFVYNVQTNKIDEYEMARDFAIYLIENKITLSSQKNLEQYISKKKDTNKIFFSTYKLFSNQEGALKNVIFSY